MNDAKHTASAFLTSLLLVFSVQASPITTLFNTGVDSSGTPLPDFTINDPHYQLISVPGGTSVIQVRTSAGGYPIGYWMGDNSLSAWIGPNNPSNNDPAAAGEAGLFTYRTTFDLTGWNASTVSISGGVASDNWLADVRINGLSLGITTGFEDFGFLTPFTISTGFVAGMNSLDFIVNNGSGPTGLRVQMTGTGDLVAGNPNTVPDGGATITMFAAALAGLVALRRKIAPA